MCPGSNGSRSGPSDIDSGKPAFTLDAPRPSSSSLRGPYPQTLTLLEGGRCIAWRLRRPFFGECWWGPSQFGGCQECLDYGFASGPT